MPICHIKTNNLWIQKNQKPSSYLRNTLKEIRNFIILIQAQISNIHYYCIKREIRSKYN